MLQKFLFPRKNILNILSNQDVMRNINDFFNSLLPVQQIYREASARAPSTCLNSGVDSDPKPGETGAPGCFTTAAVASP